MKLWQLKPFHTIFDLYLPRSLCEIGTHHGRTACQFIQYLAPRVEHLSYVGFDLFEDADQAIAKKEHNGKGPGSFARANHSLKKMQSTFPNVQVRLVRGNTTKTLEQQIFDFVYVDGGHSYQTVMHDFHQVRGSQVLIFDDYQIPGVKQAVDEIAEKDQDYQALLLPINPARPKRKQMAMFWQIDLNGWQDLDRSINGPQPA